MKKIFFLLCILFLTVFIVNTDVKAEVQLALNSKSAILIEPTTKRIIFEKEKDIRLSPASMTKIMTLALIFEDIENNKIKMEDMVTTPPGAKDIGGTTACLDTGERLSVRDMIKSVAIGSANDAAFSLAVHTSGSEEEFVKRMNEKAKEVGALNTNYVNSYGFDDPNHYTTAYDMAIISAHLINNYPDCLTFTSQYDSYIRENDPDKKFWLVNNNKLVKFMDGVDGLKTGWTEDAKYCLTATIHKNGVRFVAVVMGCDSPAIRSQDMVGLLNYAMSNYDIKTYLKKGDIVTSLEDVLIQPSKYNLVTTEDVNILKKKGTEIGEVRLDLKIDNTKIRNLDEIVGTMDVYYNNKLYQSFELKLQEDVKKSTFFDVCIEIIKELFLVS